MLPFLFAMGAALADLYPYGGTRHSAYLFPFAAAGLSFLVAKAVRESMVPVLMLAIFLIPNWYANRLRVPQEIDRQVQDKKLMDQAIASLRARVPPGEPLLSDYQSNIELQYYLGRDQPPPPERECGGVKEAQYGPYRVVNLGAWSLAAPQFTAALEGWRVKCDPIPRDGVWVFDAGCGGNLLDDLNHESPGSVFQGSHFGESISLFKLGIANP